MQALFGFIGGKGGNGGNGGDRGKRREWGIGVQALFGFIGCKGGKGGNGESFRREPGISPVAYKNKIRIERARSLILYSDFSGKGNEKCAAGSTLASAEVDGGGGEEIDARRDVGKSDALKEHRADGKEGQVRSKRGFLGADGLGFVTQ